MMYRHVPRKNVTGSHIVRRKRKQQTNQLKKVRRKGTVKQVFYALTLYFLIIYGVVASVCVAKNISSL